MAWYQVNDYVPSGGPVAAVGAGQTLQGGWIDVHGNQWSVNSSNQLVAVNNGAAFNNGELARPSSEATVDSQLQMSFVENGSSTLTAYHRWSNSGSSGTGYAVAVDNGSGLRIFAIVNGNPSQIGAQACTPAVGTAYVYKTSAVQTNSTTTTITGTLYAADGVTALATVAATDTTAALQNVSRPIAIYSNGSGAPITELTTYTDVASAATGYTLSGPQSGPVNAASSAFTVAANGSLSANVVVTPSDGGAGGTFSPTTVTLTSATTSGTFSYTPATSGAKTISTTNNGGFSNPSALTYTATSPVAVTSPAFHFSPANWKGDTGRGGSAYRQTFYAGAYFDFVFTAGSSPTAALVLASNANSLPISYFVNGVLQDNVSTASLSSLALTSLVPNVVNTVRIYVRSSSSTSRWGGTNTLQVQGVSLDSGSTPGTAAAPSKWVLFNGHSINEGWVVDAGASNFLHSASFQVIETLRSQGYDVGMMAATGSGFLATGNGGIPSLYSVSNGSYSEASSRWDKIDSGASLLDANGQISAYGATGTPPAAILVNFGTNDANQTVSQTDLRTSVKGVFGAYATAAPGAKLIMVPGFPLDVGNVGSAATSAANLSTITSGFSDAVTANPTASLTYSDFGPSFGQQIYGFAANHQDGFHPTALGNAYIAPRFQGLLTTALAPAAGAVASRFVNAFH